MKEYEIQFYDGRKKPYSFLETSLKNAIQKMKMRYGYGFTVKRVKVKP